MRLSTNVDEEDPIRHLERKSFVHSNNKNTRNEMGEHAEKTEDRTQPFACKPHSEFAETRRDALNA